MPEPRHRRRELLAAANEYGDIAAIFGTGVVDKVFGTDFLPYTTALLATGGGIWEAYCVFSESKMNGHEFVESATGATFAGIGRAARNIGFGAGLDDSSAVSLYDRVSAPLGIFSVGEATRVAGRWIAGVIPSRAEHRTDPGRHPQ